MIKKKLTNSINVDDRKVLVLHKENTCKFFYLVANWYNLVIEQLEYDCMERSWISKWTSVQDTNQFNDK